MAHQEQQLEPQFEPRVGRQPQQDQTVQLRQARSHDEPEPSTDEEAMKQIDAILARLDAGIAEEQREMDALLARLSRSLAISGA